MNNLLEDFEVTLAIFELDDDAIDAIVDRIGLTRVGGGSNFA
jgi:hypothetical protein